MRTSALGVAVALAACSSAPTCKDAVTSAAKRFGTSEAPEVATLIGSCEQHAWLADVRTCVADAKTSDALVDCLTPVKVPIPTLAPSKQVKDLVAAAVAEPVHALVFFPETSDVATVVDAYFKAAGIAVEHHDRIVELKLASTYKLARDGVVIVRGTQSRVIELDWDLQKAERYQLRDFDGNVAASIALVSRRPRKAYLVAGHGEITDRDSLPRELVGRITERKTTVLTKRFAELGYEVASLPVVTLLTDVPADATVVLLLGPSVPASAAEWAALGRYLDRGGAMLIALDPTGEPSLGALEGKLALKFDPTHLADGTSFLPQRGSLADHRLILTSQFTAHPSTTALARTVNKGLIFVDSGSLDPAPAVGPAPKQTFTIRSMDSTFRDLNENFKLDPNEHAARYNLAAAIEGPKWRALVFADVDLFADVLVQSANVRAAVVMISGTLFDDSLRWLGGEELFTPDVRSESPPIAEPPGRAEAVRERGIRDRERALARTISKP
jgi:hypothetical protein